MAVLGRAPVARGVTRSGPAHAAAADAPSLDELRGDLRRLKRMTLETPRGLQRRLARIAAVEQTARGGPPRPGCRQPAAGRFHRQALPQPRPELPGSDPGRQHGADAGGGQVRVRPRLPFLDLRHLVDPPGDQPRHRRSEPHDPRAGPHDRKDGQGPRHQSRPGA